MDTIVKIIEAQCMKLLFYITVILTAANVIRASASESEYMLPH